MLSAYTPLKKKENLDNWKAKRVDLSLILNKSQVNSTNGVKINGRKISKCVLHEGDRIKIGLEEFLFKEE